MTPSEALAGFQAAYALERQWELRRWLAERPWSRWESQWLLYWYGPYVGSNWRSMTPEECRIVWPEPKEKPKKK